VPDHLTRFIRLGDEAAAGFSVGTLVRLMVLDGSQLLTFDNREERRRRAMEKQLKEQQLELELELAKKCIIEMLA